MSRARTRRSPRPLPWLLAILTLLAGCAGRQVESDRSTPEQITIANLRNNVESLRSSLAELQRERQKLSEYKQGAREEIAGLGDRLTTLETAYRLRLEELRKLEQARADLEAQAAERERTVASLEEAGRSYAAQNDKSGNRVKELEAELQQRRANYETLRDEHLKLSEELITVSDKLAAARKSSEDIPTVITEQLVNLRAENERLSGQVATLTARLRGDGGEAPTVAGKSGASRAGGDTDSAALLSLLGTAIRRTIGEVQSGNWSRDGVAITAVFGAILLLLGYALVNSMRVTRLKRKLAGPSRRMTGNSTEAAATQEPPARVAEGAGEGSTYVRRQTPAARPGSSVVARAPSAARRKPNEGSTVSAEKTLFSQTETISTEPTVVIGGGNRESAWQRKAAPSEASEATAADTAGKQPRGGTVFVRKEKAAGGKASAGVEDEALLSDLRAMIEKNLREEKR